MGTRAIAWALALTAATLFASTPAWAETDSEKPDSEEEVLEEEPERSSTIEEIVIIGSRKQSLQQVPISVTSFSAGELKELRIQNIADLSDHTPNLEINTAFAASNPTLFIRGIGLKDYNANSSSAVAVYMDGVAINSPAGQLFQMFDVESVEVLRGPQGSLYGRNATAGAIVVNSFRPDGEWRSNGSITYGNYNDVEIEGAISFPVFDDYLQGRFAFTYQRRGGYTRNACSGWDPVANGFQEISAKTMEERYWAWNTSEFRAIQPDKFDNFSTKKKGWVATNQLELPGVRGDMKVDNICIVAAPGVIVNKYGAETLAKDPESDRFFEKGYREGQLINDQSKLAPTLEDFSKLKPYTNNADNWSARMLLRSQFVWPSAGLELLFNLHGGQNRSASFHTQSFGATATECKNEGIEGCVLSDDGEKRIIQQPYKADAIFGGWNEYDCIPGQAPNGCHPLGEAPQLVEGLKATVTGGLRPGGVKGSQERVGWYNRDGLERIDLMGIGLTALAEFDSYKWWIPTQLTWVNGFEWNDRLVELDGDGTPGVVLQSDIGDTAWQISSELRVENESSRYQWVVGGFFLRENLKAFNVYPGILSRRIEQSFDQTLTSFAPFLSGRIDFTEDLLNMGVPDALADWNLKAGVRYNWERKDFLLNSEFFFPSGESTSSFKDSGEQKTWTGVTGDATLSYNPNETTTVYAKYSRGMKGGHFNAGLTVQKGACPIVEGVPEGETCQTISAVEPEFIHSVEAGLKGRYFDGRLELTSAFFRYWYTDLQVFDIVNESGEIPTQQLLNSDANVKGIELELDARPFSGVYPPLDGFYTRLGASWLNSTFEDFTVKKRAFQGNPRFAQTNAVFDYSGNPTIAAPKWKLSGTVNWEIPISRYGSITPQYSFSYRSQVSLEPSAHDILSQPAYWLHNARLAYRTPDQHIEIAAWVRNFTDEVFLTDIFDLTRQFTMFLEIYGAPRMFGVTASYDW